MISGTIADIWPIAESVYHPSLMTMFLAYIEPWLINRCGLSMVVLSLIPIFMLGWMEKNPKLEWK
jgi:hypothetical protein